MFIMITTDIFFIFFRFSLFNFLILFLFTLYKKVVYTFIRHEKKIFFNGDEILRFVNLNFLQKISNFGCL